MPIRTVILAASLSLLTVPAWAQGDAMARARSSAANQLGILEYCQGRGAADDASIAAEKQVMARTLGTNPVDATAEATGRSGSMAMPDGSMRGLSNMASASNTTVDGLCKRMADSVKQVAAMQANSAGSTSAMPQMPQMPPMPAMPQGMSMPQMPAGMPQMPTGMPSMPAQR